MDGMLETVASYHVCTSFSYLNAFVYSHIIYIYIYKTSMLDEAVICSDKTYLNKNDCPFWLAEIKLINLTVDEDQHACKSLLFCASSGFIYDRYITVCIQKI